MKRQTADRTLEELAFHHHQFQQQHPRRISIPVLVRDGRPCCLQQQPETVAPYNVNPFAAAAAAYSTSSSSGCPGPRGDSTAARCAASISLAVSSAEQQLLLQHHQCRQQYQASTGLLRVW